MKRDFLIGFDSNNRKQSWYENMKCCKVYVVGAILIFNVIESDTE